MQRVKEKKERALGVRLYLKGERCSSHKCALVRRPYPPGVHGLKKKGVISDYGRQLREKQKMRITYLLKEKQMSNLFKKYKPEEILDLLERRLDRVVYYFGIAPSLKAARQVISHGHILVNGVKTKTGSYILKKGDKISIKESSKDRKIFADLKEKLKNKKDIPAWLKFDIDKLEGEVVGSPEIDLKKMPFDISLVAEFYSR